MSSSIGTFALTAGGVICGFLLVAGFSLHALDKIIDNRGRDAFRERVQRFWFRTAEMEFHEQFQLALVSRYSQMRSLQRLFMKGFLIIALLVAAAAIGITYFRPIEDLKGFRNRIVSVDFKSRYQNTMSDVLDQKDAPDFLDINGRCFGGADTYDLMLFAHISRVQSKWVQFNTELQRNPSLFRLTEAIVEALTAILIAIPLAAGLLVSFNLTLWLLSRVTQSRLAAIAIVVGDVLLALIMPSLLTGLTIVIIVFLNYMTIGDLVDYYRLGNPSWINYVVASISVAMSILVPRYVSEAGLAAIDLSPWSVLPAALQTIAQFAYDNVRTLMIDLGRIIVLDPTIFQLGTMETLINYAMAVDLLFSFFYIVPCLTLVLMQRSALTRRLFLNAVQWIAEHPKGPLVALSEVLTSFASYAAGLLKRN